MKSDYLQFNPEGSILRNAQVRMLEVLKLFDSFCCDNNLVYWIDSGTLLGAVRHGGFIPWDDDIDVCMPRFSFKKLKRIAKKNNYYIGNDVVLQCHQSDNNCFFPFFCVKDLKSEFLQPTYEHKIQKYRGLQVDVFPVDSNTILPIWKFCHWFFYTFITSTLHEANFKRFRFRFFARPSFFVFTKIIEPLSYFVTSLVHKENDYFMMGYGNFFGSKRPYHSVFPLKKISFEGFLFNAPHNPDDYLSSLYHDWKSIPSVDKIHTHNAAIHFY